MYTPEMTLLLTQQSSYELWKWLLYHCFLALGSLSTSNLQKLAVGIKLAHHVRNLTLLGSFVKRDMHVILCINNISSTLNSVGRDLKAFLRAFTPMIFPVVQWIKNRRLNLLLFSSVVILSLIIANKCYHQRQSYHDDYHKSLPNQS